jgi:hypothetical protein
MGDGAIYNESKNLGLLCIYNSYSMDTQPIVMGGRGGGEGEMAIVATMNVMRDKKRGRSQATGVRDTTGYATPTSYLNTRSAA